MRKKPKRTYRRLTPPPTKTLSIRLSDAWHRLPGWVHAWLLVLLLCPILWMPSWLYEWFALCVGALLVSVMLYQIVDAIVRHLRAR